LLTIGWFSTGRDEAARQLLQVVQQKIQVGEIKGKILFTFSNREPGESKQSDLFFKLVHSYHIPLISFSYKKFEATQGVAETATGKSLPQWRLEYDREVMKRLWDFNPELCVLAGYMLIVGEEMCHKYRMINLHPAAPGGPKGSWQEVIWKLIEDNAAESGVMMHLVTPELDRGPVITYCTFPIRGEPFDKYWRKIGGRSVVEMKRERGKDNALFQLIRKHGLAREFPLIVSTLKAFSLGEVKIEADRILDHNGKPISGYNLSNEVDRIVKLQ
jgi:phosphoribosylglycinamide formyltransferase-1